MEYTHFGVMLDCSRAAVMKVSEVKRMIDCLQKMGYNTLQLYTEDVYEIDGEPYFGYLRGRYSGAEIQEIDAYAKAHGIELIPCIQTLAHLFYPLRQFVYRDIVDYEGVLLIDEPKTYELIEKMFASLAKNFSSRLVNIGMDEAHSVGLGKYLDKHGYTNRFELMIRHLNKVVEIAKKYGFTPHMWSDMYFRLLNNGSYNVKEVIKMPEEVLSGIPKEIELVYYDYFSTQESYYDMQFTAHAQFNRKVWFAGAAISWFGFAPLNWYSLTAMKTAMQGVIKHGVKDVFLTMWGDNGGECSFYSLLPSLYAIRQYADGNFDEAYIKKGFEDVFHVPFDDFLALDLPNHANIFDENGKEMRQNPSKCLLYADPFMGQMDKLLESVAPIPYAEYAKKLHVAKSRAGEYAYIFDTMEKLCLVLSIKGTLGLRTRRAYKEKNKKQLHSLVKEYRDLKKLVKALYLSFYGLWHKENKAFGWEIHDVRFGGLIQRLDNCANRLQLYAKNKLERIEELEEEILDYNPNDKLLCNRYAKIVSVQIV